MIFHLHPENGSYNEFDLMGNIGKKFPTGAEIRFRKNHIVLDCGATQDPGEVREKVESIPGIARVQWMGR